MNEDFEVDKEAMNYTLGHGIRCRKWPCPLEDEIPDMSEQVTILLFDKSLK